MKASETQHNSSSWNSSLTSSEYNNGENVSNKLMTVLPGDDVTRKIVSTCSINVKDEEESRLENKLGSGLCYNSLTKVITAIVPGQLLYSLSTNKYFIRRNIQRYTPKLNDRVLVITEERPSGDYYRVTVPKSTVGSALLHRCAFEGATKRNRPHLSPGSLLYCRVCVVDSNLEMQVSCLVGSSSSVKNVSLIDGGAKSRDWMTDEGTYGELKGGSTMDISLGLALNLLDPQNVLLETLLHSNIAFELCVGVNGIVWVHSTRPEYTILVLNAIRNSEFLTKEQIRHMVKSLVTYIKSTLEG